MENKPEYKLVTLDVRPVIQSGNDPFKEIMAAKAKLNNDETLLIINIFEPIPLINKLKALGYKSWTERPQEGVVYTYFKKESEDVAPEKLEEIKTSDKVSFQQKLDSFGKNIRSIDVRHLEMPEPMVTILKEIETLEPGHALFVEHKKMPQFLLPELKNRNFAILFNEIEEGHLQLLIFKNN